MAARIIKARKQSESQDVTGAQHVVAMTDAATKDPFHIVSDDILSHIFSFLLCLKDGRPRPPKEALILYRDVHSPVFKANNPGLSSYQVQEILKKRFQSLSQVQVDELKMQEEQRYEREDEAYVTPKRLLHICKDLSAVSTLWKNVVGGMMNSYAPTQIITPSQLFQLKCRALTLHLSTVGETFMQDLKAKWGEATFFAFGQQVGVLDLIIRHYGGSEQGFANLVAAEYVKFLVIKAVEKMTYNKAYRKETRTIAQWKKLCGPPKLVKLFWQAHMQSPKKYARDCNTLIDNLLYNTTDSIHNVIDSDYNLGDVLNGYESKRNLLFCFETQLVKRNVYFGRFGNRGGKNLESLFSEWFHAPSIANEIWDNLQGYN